MTEKPAEGWAVPGSAAEPGEQGEGPSGTGPPAPAAPGLRPGGAGTAGEALARRGSGASRSDGSVLPATGLLVEGPSGAGVPKLALRPMTTADILDGAFGIIKARPARLLGLTAVFVVPVYVLAAYLQRDALAGYGLMDMLWAEDPEMVDALEEQSNPVADLGSTFLAWIGPAVVLVFVAAAVAYMLGSWSAGRDAPAGELAATVARRSWALLASFVLVHLAEAPGLLACWVGVVFIMPFFVAVAPVIGAEDAGPLASMKRSVQLVRGRYWPTLGISLLIGVVATLLDLALSLGPTVLAMWIGLDVAWPLLAAGSIMGSVVATPFVAAATVLLYLDLRVRNEGLDLELAIRDVFSEPGG